MATYFTKADARAAAQAATKRQFTATASGVLRKAMESVTDHQVFDFFLSHAVADSELVLGVKELLEKQGAQVYVDWANDPQLDRSKVNAETAAVLRQRMKQSRSMLYLATDAASSSKWMPWELGFFDGYQPGGVAIFPLLDKETDVFVGQEYLGLYPTVTKDQVTGQQTVYVQDRKRWTTLREFKSHTRNWRNF
ncbi:toll-Interleukin receptor, partial [Pelomonas aquatica]